MLRRHAAGIIWKYFPNNPACRRIYNNKNNRRFRKMAENFEDMGADLYTLVDEEGVEQTFELMDTYETDEGELYYALVPYYENPEDMVEADTELVILRSEEDENGEETLASIDDDAEYERIGQIFMDRLSETYEE